MFIYEIKTFNIDFTSITGQNVVKIMPKGTSHREAEMHTIRIRSPGNLQICWAGSKSYG